MTIGVTLGKLHLPIGRTLVTLRRADMLTYARDSLRRRFRWVA